MKKFWIRWLVIAAVFFGSIALFSVILNKGTTDMTVEMQEASLPTVSIVYGSKTVNTMYGYVERMDSGTMRDSITPIGEDRLLDFMVDSYTTGVRRISYEIRNLDGSRLIEDTVVEEFDNKRGKIPGEINLKDLINRNEEYNLNFVVLLDSGREVYYYTRVICSDDYVVQGKLDFIYDFNLKTFTESSVKELSSYMEPKADSDNTSLGNVNIHNNIKQLGWGNANPRLMSDITTTITDITRKTISAKLEYIVIIGSDTVTKYYRVAEDYVVRQGEDRYYLIDFNRTMSDILATEKSSLVNNKIVLGIQQNTPELTESDDGNIIAFENCGRIFSYDVSGNKFATLYSFYNAGDIDVRKVYNKSKARILSVEENGNVTFMLYGYMNRGTHEGQVGILVEYYNSILNTIEEQVFIKYKRSPEILMNDVDRLCYLNNQRDLYAFMDGNIISVNLDSLEQTVVSDEVIEDTLFVSKSNKYAVWQEDTETAADLMTLSMDDGYKGVLEKGQNECITAIGFMNEDLIYGVSNREDNVENALGDITPLMNRIVIRNEIGAILKEYTFDDIYITSGTINNNQVSLKRVRRTGDGSYTDIYDDQITYNEDKIVGKNTIKIVATELFEKIYQSEVKKNIDSKALKFLTPKEVLFEGGKEVEIRNADDENRYLVYIRGHVAEAHNRVAQAVSRAFDQRGIVVDNKGNEVYKRSETVARNQIMAIKEDSFAQDKFSMAVCIDTVLKYQGISRNTEYMLAKGQNPYQIFSDNMPNVHVLNLTGCTMDVALYYLNRDIPVMAVMDNGTCVLLIGYNEQNMVWFDPTVGEIYKKGMSDSRDIFEANGNRFLTYSPVRNE